MKTIFSICLAAMLMWACGSKSGKSEAVTTPAKNNISVKPLINPAHGMPGHDCAAPVGAPLTQKGVVQSENNAPIQTEVQNPPEKFSNPVKLNPEHGQPGHRCDIAVGTPLN